MRFLIFCFVLNKVKKKNFGFLSLTAWDLSFRTWVFYFRKSRKQWR